MYLEVRLGTLRAKLGNHLRYHCLERTTCPTWRVKIVSGHNMTALCLISFYFVQAATWHSEAREHCLRPFQDKPLKLTGDCTVLHPMIYKSKTHIRQHGGRHAPADLYSHCDINPFQKHTGHPSSESYLSHQSCDSYSTPPLVDTQVLCPTEQKHALCTNSNIESNTASAI